MISRGISFSHRLSRTSSWGICCQDLCEMQTSNASRLLIDNLTTAHYISKMGEGGIGDVTQGIMGCLNYVIYVNYSSLLF